MSSFISASQFLGDAGAHRDGGQVEQQHVITSYSIHYTKLYDPASKEFSTMGGNVAECAGGPRFV